MWMGDSTQASSAKSSSSASGVDAGGGRGVVSPTMLLTCQPTWLGMAMFGVILRTLATTLPVSVVISRRQYCSGCMLDYSGDEVLRVLA